MLCDGVCGGESLVSPMWWRFMCICCSSVPGQQFLQYVVFKVSLTFKDVTHGKMMQFQGSHGYKNSKHKKRDFYLTTVPGT